MAADDRPDERKVDQLNDTIFALSSGPPPAAIALVRVSGPKADQAIEGLAGKLPQARKAMLAELRWHGELLDQALVLRFPGPRSATGEDVAEFHLHGGRSVVAAVLAALGEMEGLRAAEPGEFTRRAFERGRIDLAEAEGLADLLEAETESQRRNALLLAGGALSRQAERWREALLGLSAQVEAALDFTDEDDVAPLPPTFTSDLRRLMQEVSDWLARPSAERLKEGIRVVIAGPPNAGKSSLLNALVGREAAITAAVPGTTRDVIEVPISLSGRPWLLIDTAGLRESDDEVEAIGVERAKNLTQAADLVLWLGNPDEAPDRSIKVHSKVDIEPSRSRCDVAVSAATGEGLDELVRILIQRSETFLPSSQSQVALNARHRRCLEEVQSATRNALLQDDLLIQAEDLRHGLAALDRIVGKASVEEMLDSLFGRFCIGK